MFRGDPLMKFKSHIIQDANKQIGKKVIAQGWKGRNYIKSYKKPVQPGTNPQKAMQELNRAAVKLYQNFVLNNELAHSLWDEAAEIYKISGYNFWMSGALRNSIYVPPTVDFNAGEDVQITYDLLQDPSDIAIIRLKANASFDRIMGAGELEEGSTKYYIDDVAFVGLRRYLLAKKSIFDELATPDKKRSGFCYWWTDKEAGEIHKANCVGL